MAENEVVKDNQDGDEAAASKKPLIIAAVILVVLSGAGIAYFLGQDDDVTQEEQLEESADYAKLSDYPLLLINLKEIEAPMRRGAPGVTRRRRLVMEPVLLLRPIFDPVQQKPDAAQNSAMVKRFEDAVPLMRDLCIEAVLSLDPTQDLDPLGLAEDIKKKINTFDTDDKDIPTTYKQIFGSNRVQKVYFNKLEPR